MWGKIHVWQTKEVRGRFLYVGLSSCCMKFAISACEVFQKRRGPTRGRLLKPAGKYFPDSLMIGLCQITNWISSYWLRLHFLCSRVQTPLSLNHHSDRFSSGSSDFFKHVLRTPVHSSPVQQLLVGEDLLQPAGVLQFEGEHGGGGVGGEHLDDAHGERQGHVSCDLHNAPVERRHVHVNYECQKGVFSEPLFSIKDPIGPLSSSHFHLVWTRRTSGACEGAFIVFSNAFLHL